MLYDTTFRNTLTRLNNGCSHWDATGRCRPSSTRESGKEGQLLPIDPLTVINHVVRSLPTTAPNIPEQVSLHILSPITPIGQRRKGKRTITPPASVLSAVTYLTPIVFERVSKRYEKVPLLDERRPAPSQVVSIKLTKIVTFH